MKRIGILFFSLILPLPFIFQSCQLQSKQHPVEQLFGNSIDTNNLLVLPTSTDMAYRKEIINAESPTKNGHIRTKGFAAVPQNFDDFRKQNLDEAQWQHSSVIEGDFRGASFRSANANGSVFSGSDFRLCDLRWSSFNNCILNQCNFSQSVLFRTSVMDSRLDSSDFRGSNMFGIRGHRAHFTYCDFSNALMKESELTEADFSHSRAIKVKFIITVFSGSRFDSSDYSFSDFTGAGLEECSFVDARLHGVSFKGAHLQNADFKGADLLNTDFFAAELAETNFKDAINIPEDLLQFINENGMATGVVFSVNRK